MYSVGLGFVVTLTAGVEVRAGTEEGGKAEGGWERAKEEEVGVGVMGGARGAMDLAAAEVAVVTAKVAGTAAEGWVAETEAWVVVGREGRVGRDWGRLVVCRAQTALGEMGVAVGVVGALAVAVGAKTELGCKPG